MEFQSILLPICSVGGVVIGGGLQFLFGRALESRKQLTLQKSQSYVDYFKVVALLAQGGERKDNLSMAADAKVRICIYGAPEVIEQLRRFEDVGATINTPEAQAVIIDLLKAMRRDIGKDDRALGGDVLQRILFGSLRTKVALAVNK